MRLEWKQPSPGVWEAPHGNLKYYIDRTGDGYFVHVASHRGMGTLRKVSTSAYRHLAKAKRAAGNHAAGYRVARENPLSKNEKYAAYAVAGGAVLLGGALIYHYSKTPASGSGSTTSTTSWKRIPTGGLVNSGDHVRVSISELDFQQFAATLGLPNTLGGFGQYITSLHVAPSVKIYGGPILSNPPPPSRPSDWPSDDTDTAVEYSADFTYSGPIAYPVVNGVETWVLR